MTTDPKSPESRPYWEILKERRKFRVLKCCECGCRRVLGENFAPDAEDPEGKLFELFTQHNPRPIDWYEFLRLD